MDEETYLRAFDAARRELEELTTKRAEMDGRIARLRETVLSLAYLVNRDGQTESPDVAGLGLTDAVAKVLRLSGMALTPAQIRDELARMGFNVKKYDDPIPNITKVLQRLAAKGHVDPSVHGRTARKLYIWSPMQPNSFTFDDDVTDEDLTEKVRQVFGEGNSVLKAITNPPFASGTKTRRQKRLNEEAERKAQRGPTRKEQRLQKERKEHADSLRDFANALDKEND